ncbi:MAG: (2Fe-2S) ferredoxin domain-containing protein [Rhodospirillales bacterium]
MPQNNDLPPGDRIIPPEPPTAPAGGWTIMICINRRLRSDLASCAARDSETVAQAIEREVRARGLDIRVERTVCMGRCDFGPTIRVAPGGAFHLGLGPADVSAFLDDLESSLDLKKEANKLKDLPPPGS